MAKKYLVYRIINHNGRKEFKRTKCSDYWTSNPSVCWQFSKQGAKGIVETFEKLSKGYYRFGMEEVTNELFGN